jgi:hypothetical protein
MSPAQYRKAIAALGLNQTEAAHFLGVTPRQSRRYAAGDRDIPEATVKLLKLMIERKIKPEELE